MLDIVLYEPEIPQNTGNIIRLYCQHWLSSSFNRAAWFYLG